MTTTETFDQAIAVRNVAALKLYEAEIAAHDANQTHIDEWIRAAHEHLHTAIVDYSAANAVVTSLRELQLAA